MTNLVYVPLFIPSPSHTGKLNTLPIHQKVSLDDLFLLSIEEMSSLSSFFQSADGRPLRTVGRQKLVRKSVDRVPPLVLVGDLLHADGHLDAEFADVDLVVAADGPQGVPDGRDALELDPEVRELDPSEVVYVVSFTTCISRISTW